GGGDEPGTGDGTGRVRLLPPPGRRVAPRPAPRPPEDGGGGPDDGLPDARDRLHRPAGPPPGPVPSALPRKRRRPSRGGMREALPHPDRPVYFLRCLPPFGRTRV